MLRVDVLRLDGTRPEPRDEDFVPPLRVEPHHLVLWAGRWYLIAYAVGSAAWSIYRVDRLHPHSPTGIPFTRRDLPGRSVADFVMTRPKRGDTPANWPCLGSAILSLPADLVARFAPGGSVIERVDSGHTRLTLGAWSWAGIAGILATFDADVTEIEPAHLRDDCRALSRRFNIAQFLDRMEPFRRSS